MSAAEIELLRAGLETATELARSRAAELKAAAAEEARLRAQLAAATERAVSAERDLAALRAAVAVTLALVNNQAEDAGLWFVGEKTAAEAYLQLNLRALHASVEGLALHSFDAAAEAISRRASETAQKGSEPAPPCPDCGAALVPQPETPTWWCGACSKSFMVDSQLPPGWTREPLPVRCDECNGTGRMWNPDPYGRALRVKCSVCNGLGKVKPETPPTSPGDGTP